MLIDPLGATLAVVVLQFAPSGFHADPILWVPSRLLGGLAFGLVGVAGVRAVLCLHRTPPARDMTLLLLGMSVATLALAERVLPDSGLTAMATMGVVLAGMRLPHAEEVREFEDELSRILLAAVYVLSAATLKPGLLAGLARAGFVVVAALMVLVRPLEVQAMRALLAGAGTGGRGGQDRAARGDPALRRRLRRRARRPRRERGHRRARRGPATRARRRLRREADGTPRRARGGDGRRRDEQRRDEPAVQPVRARREPAGQRLAQGRAVEAFCRSGIHAVGEGEAIAEAMMTTIGQPVLHDALGPGGHGRLTVEFEVGSGLDGRRIRDLRLPQRVLVLLVRRADEDVIPDGNTVIGRGDRLLLYGTTDTVREARSQLALIE